MLLFDVTIYGHMRSIERWHFQWQTLTWFSRSLHFWSRISQIPCV